MVTVVRGDVILSDLNPVVVIIRVLGHVDDTYMEEVARALRTILGL